MSVFAVVEIPAVDWLRKFKIIVLFSVNNEREFGVFALFLQRFRVWILSGERNYRNARKTFLFVGFGFGFFLGFC